jgi:Fe-Mn family superoxide dismutase
MIERKSMPTSDADTDGLGADAADIAGALVIDVRRAAAFDQAAHMLPGAVRGDPDKLEQWSPTLDTTRDIVVYCVHGHEVSRGAASQLCARGLRARFLRGGFAGWEAAGLPLTDKP